MGIHIPLEDPLHRASVIGDAVHGHRSIGGPKPDEAWMAAFYGCASVTSIDLTNLHITSDVTDTSDMFRSCPLITDVVASSDETAAMSAEEKAGHIILPEGRKGEASPGCGISRIIGGERAFEHRRQVRVADRGEASSAPMRTQTPHRCSVASIRHRMLPPGVRVLPSKGSSRASW